MSTTTLPVGSRGLGNARGFKRDKNDNYPTDPKLAHALMITENFDGAIWEPACGDGRLSTLMSKTYGHKVVSTDLHKYGFGRSGVDFLNTKKLLAPNVVTNPPFSLWQPFAEHALKLGAHKVALLGRVLLLEGWKRSEFFKQSGLSRVVIVGRANMRPPKTKDKGMTGMIAFAWYVWERDHKGPPTITWSKPQ
jgi:hypothetical protein